MARALGVLLPLLLLGALAYLAGRASGRRDARARLEARTRRLSGALDVVAALRALTAADPLAEPAQHALRHREATHALDAWDRSALEG